MQDENYYVDCTNKSLSDDDNLYIHFRILYELQELVFYKSNYIKKYL